MADQADQLARREQELSERHEIDREYPEDVREEVRRYVARRQ